MEAFVVSPQINRSFVHLRAMVFAVVQIDDSSPGCTRGTAVILFRGEVGANTKKLQMNQTMITVVQRGVKDVSSFLLPNSEEK